MPARCVVFSGTRKHDDHSVEDISERDKAYPYSLETFNAETLRDSHWVVPLAPKACIVGLFHFRRILTVDSWAFLVDMHGLLNLRAYACREVCPPCLRSIPQWTAGTQVDLMRVSRWRSTVELSSWSHFAVLTHRILWHNSNELWRRGTPFPPCGTES